MTTMKINLHCIFIRKLYFLCSATIGVSESISEYFIMFKNFYENSFALSLGRPYHFMFFKGYLPQISLGPFQNTLTNCRSQQKVTVSHMGCVFCYLDNLLKKTTVSSFIDVGNVKQQFEMKNFHVSPVRLKEILHSQCLTGKRSAS